MKVQRLLFVLAAIFLTGITSSAQSTGETYQKMSRHERSTFVASQARRIARDLTGREYEFTAAFEEDIQQSLNAYARRLNASAKSDLRPVLERGRNHAPTLTAAFRARNLSPLYGLYIPFVESEFRNIEAPNQVGAMGMFQFVPATGEKYGLSLQDLLDVSKSADAAARYITDSLEQFKDDPMKEALAILSYNRGVQKTRRDLNFLTNDQNRGCSICTLNADRSKLDETFRHESVFYVPRFFAAAIIGENPQAFGLPGQPLSSY
ncbi:MAG TPA: transglycosylase SLT domain-containing protein [Pyrinomonadaceae bacterium]|nr:transglycosylase SLT domain-containing protein [Pyrinomonadaceae bacterium]